MKFYTEDTIDKIRRGYYTAVYFNRTKEILLREKNLKIATMQIFQKHEGSILCGADEVVELLKVGTGYWESENPKSLPRRPACRTDRQAGEIQNPNKIQNPKSENSRWVDKSGSLEVKSLKDGDKLTAWETVMHITGPYVYFAHLESLYLGILARRTLVATNVRRCVEAASINNPISQSTNNPITPTCAGRQSASRRNNETMKQWSNLGKPIIFFADRFDHFLNQQGDGYAAHVGGASSVCTDAHGEWWGGKPVGTIPHSLIAVNNGSTIASVLQFHRYFPEVNLIALVDFDNNCVRTSLEVARKFGDRLWGVRLDTAGEVIDKSLNNKQRTINKEQELHGVNPYLVKAVREALDKEGFQKVKIVVSGGFNAEKIKKFEEEKVSVDVYGIGSALIHGENDFTADIVMVEGKKMAKVGREFKPNKKFIKVI